MEMSLLDRLPPSDMPLPVPSRGMVLVVDDEENILKLISVALRKAHFEVTTAVNGQVALDVLRQLHPNLIISDIMMPEIDGLDLLGRLRADRELRSIPFILLTAKGSTEDIIAGLDLGADDYLAKPFALSELLARVRAKVERPPVPLDELPRNQQTGLLTDRFFMTEVRREVGRSSVSGCLAYLALHELPHLRERLGKTIDADIQRQTIDLLLGEAQPLDSIGHDTTGVIGLLLPETDVDVARQRLTTLARRIASNDYRVAGERARLTPLIGFLPLSGEIGPQQLRDQGLAALHSASLYLDLLPVRYAPGMDASWKWAEKLAARHSRWWYRLWQRTMFPLQITLVQLLCFGLPFVCYTFLAAINRDITTYVYMVVVMALLVTSFLILIESVLALKSYGPPEEPGSPYPVASAIIAAYLPNEAATIIETVEAFLCIDYPVPLQIILAYNTPRDLPIEVTLHEIAARDPRFQVVRVDNSTSKAQNVNAVLSLVQGEFVGVFDADHLPDSDSFIRAWRWLSHGYDIVQGHCVIRNGAQSLITRLVSVEFEVIYALSHPGRTMLHGFGIFGGTNGFWKTSLLNVLRMHGFMLTEDIDSSIRAVTGGYKIATDRWLISRELAPITFRALWNQRMRWAQGWFQVSVKHFWYGFRSPHLNLQQKLGLFHLLAWREVYPWLSIQIVPIIAYWSWHYGGIQHLNWLVPFFLITSACTLLTGPAQLLMAYTVASPSIRRHRWWFVIYVFAALLFYANFKNMIATIAQLKHLMRERQWKVTPRVPTKPV